MSTLPPSPRVESSPDPLMQNQMTVVEVGLAGKYIYFKERIGTSEIYLLRASLGELFSVEFARYDLRNNRKTGEVVRYMTQGRKPEIQQDTNEIRLVYRKVAPESGGGDTIDVTVFIQKEADSRSAEWVKLDIHHTYPNLVRNGDTNVAWEENLIFPNLRFDPMTAEEVAAAREKGVKEKLTFSVAEARFYESVLPPCQFGAFYLPTGTFDATNFAQGIAIHLEDEHGHKKAFTHTTRGDPVNSHLFSLSVVNAIHLKNGAYVHAGAYQLSKGDNFGFGGSLATCRVRAFNLPEAYPGLAVGEYDVLNIYRRWLKKRNPSFMEKYVKPPYSAAMPQNNAPLDNMNPHTLVVNYGLDGAIDPPPQGAKFPDLHRWLEVHPLVDSDWGKPNTTTSVLDLLNAMKKRLGTGLDVKVEAQIFGFEPGGLFSFIGNFPPKTQPRIYQFATNVISGDPAKFKRAMDTLAAAGIIPLVTTSPFNLPFNRARFGGHFIRRTANEPWATAIPYQFPAAYKIKSCAVTNPTIRLSKGTQGRNYDRLWIVEPFPDRVVEPAPQCDDADRIRAAQRMDETGKLVEPGAVLGTGFYKLYKKGLCPTEDMKNLYVQDWLKKGLFANGVRLLEFMLHFTRTFFCYNRAHQHIEAKPQYDNVIGHGAWYVARARKVLEEVRDAGKSLDARNPLTLTNEDVPIEQFIPYFDDYYYSDHRFNFLYSAHVTPKMALHRDFMIHPGYKEARKDPTQPPGVVLPEVMVKANLETEKPHPTQPGVKINRLPPPHTTARQLEDMVTALLASLPPGATEEQREAAKAALVKRVTDTNAARALSFNLWLKTCREYFETYFKVVEYGIAPRGYPVGPEDSRPKLAWNPARPLNPSNNPPTYTYVRCVQDVFNMWANIFETGTRAVFGDRVFIPSIWFETPTDYNEPAIGMAVRAAQFQMRFKDYFRRGQILGDALMTSVDGVPFGKKSLWCWGTADLNAQRRTFYDVVNNELDRLLVDNLLPGDIAADDLYFGGAGVGDRWRERDLTDLISRSVDKPVYKFKNGKGEQVEVAPDYRTYLKVPHLVWQSGEGDARTVLYAFCNIGNTAAQVEFRYGRGLERVSQAAKWHKTVTTFSEPATAPRTGDAYLGMPEPLTIPPLSLVGIEIKRP